MSDLLRGRDFLSELRLTRHSTLNCIFDVGANVGQSAVALGRAFPKARIFSFEPVPESFAALRTNTAGLANVTAFNLGLGRHSIERVRMQVNGIATENHIVVDSAPNENMIEVELKSGDRFCQESEVDVVDYLKIDAEGSDLNVLLGFSSKFSNNKISFVEVECGMNSRNLRHVGFGRIYEFMTSYGFEIFGFYEQVREFAGRIPLRRANVVFVAGHLT